MTASDDGGTARPPPSVGRAADGVLSTTLVSSMAGLVPLVDEWDELCVRAARPCSAPALLLPWWRQFGGAESALRVVAVRDASGRMVGLAPFLIEPGSFGTRQIRLFGTPTMPQRSGILAAPGRMTAVARAVATSLAASSTPPDAISLDRIDASPGWDEVLASSWPSRWGATVFRGLTVPAPVLSMSGRTFEQWLQDTGGRFAKGVRRTRARIERRGGRIVRLRERPDLERALDAFVRLHGAHWGSRSRLWSPQAHAMLHEAAVQLAPSGRMRIYGVDSGDGLVAVLILFSAGGEVTAWNAGWDRGWARERPAAGALHAAIADCFALGDRRLDLGDNPQQYKLRIADGDDPVTWSMVLPRTARFPQARAALMPDRTRFRLRQLARHLPEPARRRITTIRGRLS